jgi:hypothetical protein
MTNTGLEYELITKKIFEEILAQDSVNTTKIEHDIILKGKDSEHQIDVFWEFEAGGIQYSNIVQAKDWRTTKVNQGELFKFKCILNDLPGQPRGIFVTKTGYQKGAKEFANKNGILLYELREPTEKDWEDRISTIKLNISIYIPNVKDVIIESDKKWMKSERKRLEISEDEIETFDLNGDSILYDELDVEISTIDSIIKSLITEEGELEETERTYKFDNATFIKTDNPKIPKIKITEIKCTISVGKINERIILKAEDFIGFILKNVIDDTEKRFDKKLKIISKK